MNRQSLIAISAACWLLSAFKPALAGENQPPAEAVKPFQLKIEKRAVPGEPSNAPQSLRIQRDQLNLNVDQMPPVAPEPYRMAAPMIDPNAFKLNVGQPQLQGRAAQSAPLRGGTSAQYLAQYEVELIVDESLSMRHRDCPGRLSRWEWCGLQLRDLSRHLSPYTPQGFTLTTFAGDFQSYPNSRPEHVQQLFANPNFTLGTRLSLPLNARLNNYFSSRNARSKPLLIVVITDGVPAPRMEPPRVARALIDASNRVVNPGEVTVVFFQIGGADRFGRYFLDEMDNSLVSYGARHDIVRTVTFEQLQHQGLTGSLISSIRNFAYRSAAR